MGTDTSVIARGYNRMPEIVTQRSRRHPSVTEYILIEGYVELRALLQAPQQCGCAESAPTDEKPTATFRFYGLLQRQTRGELNNFQSKGRQSHAG